MNRRFILLRGALVLTAVLAAPITCTSAMRLPTSTLTVKVLSVDRESFNQEETKYPGRPTVVFETSKYVAKAQITEVLTSDHRLRAGDVIDIRYSVTVRRPPHPGFRVRSTLTVGETATLTIFGGGGAFEWRN